VLWFLVLVAIVNVLVGIAVAIVLITGSWREVLKGLPQGSWIKTQMAMRPMGEDTDREEIPAGGEELEVPFEEDSQFSYDLLLVDLLTEQAVHRRQLLDLEHRLWGPHRPAEAAQLESYAEYLRQMNQSYLLRQQSLVEQVGRCADASTAVISMGEQIELTLDEEAVQLQRVGNDLARVDFQLDPPDAACRLFESVQTLLHAGHVARDAWRELRAVVSRQAGSTLDAILPRDELTGLPDRSGLELELCDWWQKDANSMRELSLAVIDLDGMGALNEQQGVRVGDQVLQIVAQIIKRELSGVDTLFRFAGQQFAVLSPDANPVAVGAILEKIREQVARAQLQVGPASLRVTVSCGVTEAHPQDTPDDFCQRATAAVTAAKLCGRNRTYVDRSVHAESTARAA